MQKRRKKDAKKEVMGMEKGRRESAGVAETEVIECRRRPSRAEDLPTRFVPVGGRVRMGGVEYECVEAGAETCPSAACSGCDFSREGRGCWSLQCSPFDRRDGKFVWFREVG